MNSRPLSYTGLDIELPKPSKVGKEIAQNLQQAIILHTRRLLLGLANELVSPCVSCRF